MRNFTHDETNTQNLHLSELRLKAAVFSLFLFKDLTRTCHHVHLIKTLELPFKSLPNNYS